MSNHSLTPLQTISTNCGQVLRFLRRTDPTFTTFGEVYISTLNPSCVNAWKLHTKATCNLIVPVGDVLFVVKEGAIYYEYRISPSSYALLTIMPGVWFGFKSLSDSVSYIMNLSSLPHTPTEVTSFPLNAFDYNWNP